MFGFPFSFKHKVDPEKFIAVWPTYFAASKSATELKDGQKISKLWDMPEIQAIAACRTHMLQLGIPPTEAAAYGSRLSLAKTVILDKDLSQRFAEWIRTDTDGPYPTQILLKLIATTKIKKYGIFGIMLDFDNLEQNLKKEKHATI